MRLVGSAYEEQEKVNLAEIDSERMSSLEQDNPSDFYRQGSLKLLKSAS